MKRNTLALASAPLILFSACTKIVEKSPVTTYSTTVSDTTTSGTSSQTMALDASFGSGGKVITAVTDRKDIARGIAAQSDGKIVVAGQSQMVDGKDGNKIKYAFTLTRYDANGNLDRKFGVPAGATTAPPTSGSVTTTFPVGATNVAIRDAQAMAMKIDSGNSIFVAGSASNGTSTDFAVVKYRPDGTVDTTFNYGVGARTIDFFAKNDIANAMAIESTGNLILAGTSYDPDNKNGKFAIVRVFGAGTSEDYTFGQGVTNYSLQRSAGGRVLLNFNQGQNQGANAVALQSDGKIVVGGWVRISGQRTTDFAIARLTSTGVLDTTFGNQGLVTTDFGFSKNESIASIAIQPDGKIVAGGYADNGHNTDFALARYNADGTPDTSFGSNGRVTTDFGVDDYITSITIQPSGGILAAGYTLAGNFYQFAVARYLSTGALDTGFGKQTIGFGAAMNAYARASFVASDGSLFLAGETYPGNTQLDLAVAKLR